MIFKKYRFILLILISAFLLRLAFICFYPGGVMLGQELLSPDGELVDQYALNTLGSGFWIKGSLDKANDLFPPTYPAYVFFLSLIYFIFGHNLLIVRIIQVILSSLTCVIVYLMAKEVGKKESVAKISALIAVFYYPIITANGYIMTESLFIFLLTVSVLLLIKAINRSSAMRFFLSGLCWGLAVLTRSVIWSFTALLIIYLIFVLKNQRLHSVKYIVIFILGILVTIFPWSVRNYKLYGIFSPVVGGGFYIYAANNPTASAGAGGWYMLKDLHLEKDIMEEASKLSVPQLEKFFLKRALRFVLESPKKFAILAAKKFMNMWRPYYSGARLLNKIIMVCTDLLFIYPLSISGMILWRNKKSVILFYLLIAYYCLIHMVLISVLRYRLPVAPFLIIFSAFALEEIIRKNWFFKTGGN